MFSESCACGINLLHIAAGQFGSIVQNPAMRWFLKVWIALSAAFTRWLCGSTNCILMLLASRYVCTVLLATLSIILNCGLKPRLVRYSTLLRYASMMEVSLTSVTGVARMALVVQSYRIKMDVIPSIDRRGNLPVKSV